MSVYSGSSAKGDDPASSQPEDPLLCPATVKFRVGFNVPDFQDVSGPWAMVSWVPTTLQEGPSDIGVCASSFLHRGGGCVCRDRVVQR